MKRLLALVIPALLLAAPASSQVAISGLPAATGSLAGTEVVPIVQGGTTRQASASAIAATITLHPNTWSGKQTFPLSTTSLASVNLPNGVAPTAPLNGDVWTTTTGLFTQVNGASVGPLLSAATIAGVDLSASNATATGGTSRRPIGDHLLDLVNPLDWGAVGDGATDSGPATLSAIAAGQSRRSTIIFPHTASGYKLNGTVPGLTITANGNSYSYPSVLLGKYEMGGNVFSGSMVGTPYTGNGLFNQTYTNPYNVVTGIKYTFDPAAMPLKSAGTSPNDGGVTNVAMSIECAPNRPNPLSVDSGGTASPNHNWIACLYAGADTGKGGASGTTINTGVANYVLNVDENTGTNIEFDVNSNGTGIKDNGPIRGVFVAGGGNPGNVFGHADGTGSVAFGTIHSAYDGSAQPWGTAYEAKSCILCFSAYVDATGLGSTGTPFRLVSANGAVTWKIDVNGYDTATGFYSQTSVNTLTVQLRPRGFAALPACSSTYEGLDAAVTDANTNTLGATITAGGSTFHVKVYCDGTNWTVEAK